MNVLILTAQCVLGEPPAVPPTTHASSPFSSLSGGESSNLWHPPAVPHLSAASCVRLWATGSSASFSLPLAGEREKKSSGMTEPRGGRGKRAGIHIKGARAGGKNRARCELVVWLAAEWGSLWTQHLWICIHYLCSAAPEPPRPPSSPPNRDWRVRLRVAELSQGVIG